jgi:hypothetical protein
MQLRTENITTKPGVPTTWPYLLKLTIPLLKTLRVPHQYHLSPSVTDVSTILNLFIIPRHVFKLLLHTDIIRNVDSIVWRFALQPSLCYSISFMRTGDLSWHSFIPEPGKMSNL